MPTHYEIIFSIVSLRNAWIRIKQKNSASGIDGMTVADFDRDVNRQLQILSNQLQEGKYKPQPYLSIEIPKKKSSGEYRQLSMLSVRDKIVQEAIKNLIEPRCEKLFLGSSYAYRPQKGTLKAIRRTLSECKNKKYKYVMRLDIDNFFDKINHEVLKSRLMAVTTCPELINLIMLIAKMGKVSQEMKWNDVYEGIPQGALLSPLLSNLYLHSFDQFMRSCGFPYIRYADDFVVLIEDEAQAENTKAVIEKYLKDKLKLSLNQPEFVKIDDGFEFLGVIVNRSAVSISNKKREEIYQRISAFDFGIDGFSKKDMKSLDGLQKYYAKLLPESELEGFDEQLQKRLINIIQEKPNSFASKKALANCLNLIVFLSEKYRISQRIKIKEILDVYSNTTINKSLNSGDMMNRKLIQSRKLEYHRKEVETSEIIISKPGAFVGISQKRITVKEKGKILMQQSTSNLSHIVILGCGVSISSNILGFCMDNSIPIDLFDNKGHHIGSFLSTKFLESSFWRPQSLCDIRQRQFLAAAIIAGKLRNQLNLAKYFYKYHKNKDGALDEKLLALERVEKSFVDFRKQISYTEDGLLTKITGFESQGAIKYWDFIRQLISDDGITFANREHKGAKDIFNSMLNYGYSLLYSRVWQALLSARLNPYDSLIHVAVTGKPSLVYDFVELFRSQAVDRVIISLVQKHLPLEIDSNGYLTEATRAILVKNIVQRFNRYENFRGIELKFEQIITLQAKSLAESFVSGKSFKPYIAKW